MIWWKARTIIWRMAAGYLLQSFCAIVAFAAAPAAAIVRMDMFVKLK